MNTTIKEIPWEQRWQARHPYYRLEAYFSARVSQHVLGCDYQALLGICLDGMMSCYYDMREVNGKARTSLTYFSDNVAVQEYMNTVFNTKRKLGEMFAEIGLQMDILDNEQLARLIERGKGLLETLFAAYDLSRPEYGTPLERSIKNYLTKQHVPQEMLDDVYFDITTSNQESILSQEQKAWQYILNCARAGEDVHNMLSKHSKKFGWIGMAEQPEVWGVTHYKKKLERELSIPAAKKKKSHDAEKTSLEVSDKTAQRYVNIARFLARERLEIRYAWIHTSYLLRPVIAEISRRTEINREELERYYSLPEMSALLRGENTPEHREIIKRDRYALFFTKGTLIRFAYNEMQVAVDAVESREMDANNGVITGLPVSKGVARGRVKVINSSFKNQQREVDLMQEGDILVTGMTRPHLIDAIKLSGAIITDEGGVLSHAAIIARELKKPCIIGTKIATKVLKDGDLVEVNADKGIVTILKRGK